MDPERRGSKKSFCPRRSAAGESRYLLVLSTGRSGNGERVLMISHSSWENISVLLSGNWLTFLVLVAALPECPEEVPNINPSSRPKHSPALRIGPPHGDLAPKIHPFDLASIEFESKRSR